MTKANIVERAAAGKRARSIAPRSGLASWAPAADRGDPIAVLEAQAASRVPMLVPLRHGRMLQSPFAFYRGAAALMARDLADSPRTGLTVQLCGDAHLANFGLYAAPDRRLVFSINDFDETLPGPFEWDVERLAASFAVAGRYRGFDARARADVVRASARSYREAMQQFAGSGWMDLWYARLDADQIVALVGQGTTKQQRANLDRTIAKSRSKDRIRATEKLTHLVDGELRFISAPPLIVPIRELLPGVEADQLNASMQRILTSYRRSLQSDRRALLKRYTSVDLAHKVVGVGSVGTRAWIMLLVGSSNDDPLILQLKEAQASVLEPYLGAAAVSHHGQRVVQGQLMMQAASDILLGWHRTAGIDGITRDFYVRQLWDSKGSAEIERMEPIGMRRYAELCGWTLARAHARSGDPAAIAGYLGTSEVFDRSMSAFAEAYADQTDADHAALRAAVASGRLQAEEAQPGA